MIRKHYLIFDVDDGTLVADLIIDAQLGIGTQVILPMLSEKAPRRITKTGIWDITRNPAIVISQHNGEGPVKLIARKVGELPEFEDRYDEYKWIQAWEKTADLPEGTS